MSVPALQALRSRFPSAHIAILAKPWVADLYGREPFCDQLIPYTIAAGVRGGLERFRLAARLRKEEFDTAILLPNSFDSAALIRATGIPRRIGYRQDWRGWLLSDAIPIPGKHAIPAHQRFYYLELLRRAGVIDGYPPDAPIRLAGARDAALKGRELLQNASLNLPVIGVSPGAAYGTAKRWLPERFAQAAVQIARDRDATVAVFGTKEELEVCAQVQRSVEADGVRCMNLAGTTNLGSFIEMTAACEIYLTNDSGPMHIASALGVPTVVVFGPTQEDSTGPTGDCFRIIREPVECSPCMLRECPIDHRCMTRVPAQRVVEAAFTLREAVHK